MRVAILLAAGRSRRFGAADKLLAPLWGKPLLCWALRAARAAPVSRIIVAVPRRGPLACRLDREQVQIVHVAHPECGLAESLRAAMRALRPRERELLVFLGDMPLVPRELAAKLVRSRAVRPRCRKQPGHPVRMSRPDPARLFGDEGMRALIGPRPRMIPGPRGCVLDIDSRAALLRLRLRPGGKPR